MYQKAARLKLRFATTKGNFSVEDLFDMPLKSGVANLNSVAIGLSKALKDAETESFVDETPVVNDELQLKFDIVKDVIRIRVEEKKKAELAADTRAKKQRLMGIIARKEDEKDESMSLDELRKMVDEL